MKWILLMVLILNVPLKATGTPLEGSQTIIPQLDLSKFEIVYKGAICPFTGYLISHAGVAKIITKFDLMKKDLELKLNFCDEKWKLKLEKQKKEFDIELGVEKKKHEDLIAIKDEQIRKLKENYNPKKIPFIGSRFWTGMAIGVVTTVAITFGSVYLWSKVK